jgi:hypothetical protein
MAAGDSAITCGNNLADFFALLAQTLVKDANGINYFRINMVAHDCEDIEAVVNCENAVVDPKELLKQAFYVDECENGILTINVSYTAGE